MMSSKSQVAVVGHNSGHLLEQLGTIVQRAPSECLRNDRNPRAHSEKQIVKFSATIRQFAVLVPILITPVSEIIAGEAKVEAAISLGLATIPTTTIDHP